MYFGRLNILFNKIKDLFIVVNLNDFKKGNF